MYDVSTKTVKTKSWPHLPACTSALRWLEHYYCFHGNNFTRFNPISGEVNGTYPKDARDYFMRCPNFGEFILDRPSHSCQPLNQGISHKVALYELQDTELAIKSLSAARSN